VIFREIQSCCTESILSMNRHIRIIDLFIFSIYGQRQSHWLIYLINWQTTRDPLTYMYRLLTDNDRPINLFFLAFWRATTYPLTSLSRLQTATINPFTYFFSCIGRQRQTHCPFASSIDGQRHMHWHIIFLPIWI
jgi:hypothetical protein